MKKEQKEEGITWIAAVNYNKNAKQKLLQEGVKWMHMNDIDILIIADTGREAANMQKETLWCRHSDGQLQPSTRWTATERIGIAWGREGWDDCYRADQRAVSPTGRSLSISFRLNGARNLEIIRVYFPTTPLRNREDTEREYAWIAERVHNSRAAGHYIIMGGDWNMYPDEQQDRKSTHGISQRHKDLAQ